MQIGIKLSACLSFRFICIHTADLSSSPLPRPLHQPNAPVAQFGGAARMWVKLLLPRLLLLHYWQSYRKQKQKKEVEQEVQYTERNNHISLKTFKYW